MDLLIKKILPLQLSFLIFSMLLNCMGIIILKYSENNISYTGLGILEAFKDVPIALVSLFSVNYINKFGTKKSLISSLVLVSVCCFALPFLDAFWFFKIWFVIIGIGFAIAKISVFSIIRSNVQEENLLAKVLSRVEAAFMIGIFCVNIGFGWLLSSPYEEYWRFGFWGIAITSVITIILLFREHYEKQQVEKRENINFKNLKKLFTKRTILLFTILFLIVFTEQSFNSWLPTFYKTHLKTNSFFALQSSAFMALFSFAGRMLTSKLITRFSWFQYIFFCLSGIIILLGLSQFLQIDIQKHFYILMILFPVLGLFISPLYPLYNSKILINYDKNKANMLVSFIVIFSSLGSSIGSITTSVVFQNNLGEYFSIYAMLPAIVITIITIIFFKDIASYRDNA